MAVTNRFKVAGRELADRVRQLAGRGDVRRVCIIDEEKSILEVPLMTGDPAAPATMLKAPVLAAIKAFGTLVNECTIEVEQEEGKNKSNVPGNKE